MRRKNRGRKSQKPKLSDVISDTDMDKLSRLRETLEQKARDTIADQLSESPPPWRQQKIPFAGKKSGKTEKSRGSRAQTTGAKHQQHSKMAGNSVGTKTKQQPATKPKLEPQKPEFQFWDFPDEAAVRERPPLSISDAHKKSFEETIWADADSSTAGTDELFVILGLDFGTSSSKMIARLPFEAGEPTIAIPAPHPCQSEDVTYLWQTVTWLRTDGTFIPWPEPGATQLHSLKQGLIHGRGETELSISNTNLEVSRAEASVAYLTFVVRYMKGWLLRSRPNLFHNRKPIWFLNIGMPTASYDELEIAKPYRRIAAAALQLSKVNIPVTVETVRLFLADKHVEDAAESEKAAEDMGVAVFPETAAEMAGFAKSTRNAPGLYLLVDVGAMTLDACMFRLGQDDTKGDHYNFMVAQVRPLGVDSFHWFLKEGKTEKEFIHQCNRMLWSVVWETKKSRDPKANSWKPGYDVPVFLAGGGASNQIHRNIVESLDPWLKEHTSNDGIRVLNLPIPGEIELPEPLQDFNRMGVAWGLSNQPTEIGEIRPMRDIEDILPPDSVDITRRFISKDDV